MSPITNRKQWKNCFASPSLRLINPIYFCGQSVANLIGNNDIITTSYKNLPLNIMMSSQYIIILPLQIIKLLLKIKDMTIHINMSCGVPNKMFGFFYRRSASRLYFEVYVKIFKRLKMEK